MIKVQMFLFKLKGDLQPKRHRTVSVSNYWIDSRFCFTSQSLGRFPHLLAFGQPLSRETYLRRIGFYYFVLLVYDPAILF